MSFIKAASILLLLLSLVVRADQVAAQSEFAPSGAEWCLRGYGGAGETLGYVRVRYESDTLITGVPTKVMSITAKAATPDGLETSYYSPEELFQQSGDSIFYYEPVITDRVYLFKRQYEVGEETYSWLYNEPFEVSYVEETLVDGVEITVAKMNLLPWLERDLPTTMYGWLGPDRGFTENWSSFLNGQGGLNLEAFRATATPEIKIVDRSKCFALMDSVNLRVITRIPIRDCQIVPFPNPVLNDETVRIKLDCGRPVAGSFLLRVYDAGGKAAMPPRRLTSIPASFPVTRLAGGVYFGVLSGEGARFNFTFTVSR